MWTPWRLKPVVVRLPAEDDSVTVALRQLAIEAQTDAARAQAALVAALTEPTVQLRPLMTLAQRWRGTGEATEWAVAGTCRSVVQRRAGMS